MLQNPSHTESGQKQVDENAEYVRLGKFAKQQEPSEGENKEGSDARGGWWWWKMVNFTIVKLDSP